MRSCKEVKMILSYLHLILFSFHSSHFIFNFFQFHFHLCLSSFHFVIIFLICKIELSVYILEMTLYFYFVKPCIASILSINRCHKILLPKFINYTYIGIKNHSDQKTCLTITRSVFVFISVIIPIIKKILKG